MNAAARSLTAHTWFRGHVKQVVMTKEGVLVILLLIAVLMSALAVVYVKNEQRTYFSALQLEKQTTAQLDLEWHQLVLEQSAMSAPARVQRIAHQQLHMVLPVPEKIILVQDASSSV